jgi:CBS domain containing-hemolysin-like protein
MEESSLSWLSQFLAMTSDLFTYNEERLLEPGMIGRYVVQVLLFSGSAYFSGSETALFSLSPVDLQKLRRQRNRFADVIHSLLERPRRLIISILCGNELINIAASANMAVILLNLFGEERAGWFNLIVMVPLLLLFGEVTPKTISVSNPVLISTRVVAGPMSIWVKFVAPLRWLVRIVADFSTTLIVGKAKAKENLLNLDEFRTVVQQVTEQGELTASESTLITKLLDASETQINEIMIPRTGIRFIRDDISVAEMLERFKRYRHPRLPVYHRHRDHPVGFLNAEDMIRLVRDKVDLSTVDKQELIHPPIVVPPTKKIDEMFDFFKANEAHAALVVNEHGGVDGMVTMGDVIYFLYGEMTGHTIDESAFTQVDNNIFEIAGEMNLSDFNDLTNFGVEDAYMTTIGGVVFRLLDHLPQVGDTVNMDNIVFTVLAMNNLRIDRLRAARVADVDEHLEEEGLKEEIPVAELPAVSEAPSTVNQPKAVKKAKDYGYDEDDDWEDELPVESDGKKKRLITGRGKRLRLE